MWNTAVVVYLQRQLVSLVFSLSLPDPSPPLPYLSSHSPHLIPSLPFLLPSKTIPKSWNQVVILRVVLLLVLVLLLEEEGVVIYKEILLKEMLVTLFFFFLSFIDKSLLTRCCRLNQKKKLSHNVLRCKRSLHSLVR